MGFEPWCNFLKGLENRISCLSRYYSEKTLENYISPGPLLKPELLPAKGVGDSSGSSAIYETVAISFWERVPGADGRLQSLSQTHSPNPLILFKEF